MGVDFFGKNIRHGDRDLRIQLWDTSGNDRYLSLIPNYLKDARIALIVVDVSNKASLNNT